MKKIFGIIIILFLLSINFAIAGETYKIDFSKQNEFLVGLKQGDRAEFNLKNERNTVILTKIKNSSVELKAYIALNTRNSPYYVDLKKGNKFNLDIDRDGIADVDVRLYKIQEEIAALYFTKIEGSLWPVGSVVLDTGNRIIRNNRIYDLFIVGFFILAGMIMITLIFKRYFFKKEKITQKTEIKNEEK